VFRAHWLIVLLTICALLLDALVLAAAASEFPIHMTDTLGRQVTIKTLPQRIVSLAPSNTERLFAVGAWHAVVGVTTVDTYPPAVTTVPKVGGFVPKSMSLETIVSLKPDLVLAAGELQRPTIEALERVGLTVVAIEDPGSFDEVYADITLVGRLTGHEQEARRVVEEIQSRLERVRQAVATLPQEKRVTVFYEVYDEPLMTVGRATIIGQLLEMAGGINVFADLGGRYPQVSSEEVVRRNPSCILGHTGHQLALTPAQISQRPGWSSMLAVKQHCIRLLNGDIVARPGPRLAEALEAITRALYPDLLP
jgi:iron complex transport system substrate-binding protein